MEWTVAIITIFGTVASVTGVILYVFNGTKKIIMELRTTTQEIRKTNQEISERTAKLDEHFAKMDEKMDKYFAKMDEMMDKHFAKMDEKMDKHFAKMEERFTQMDERWEASHKEAIALLKRMTDLIEARLPAPVYSNPRTKRKKRSN